MKVFLGTFILREDWLQVWTGHQCQWKFQACIQGEGWGSTLTHTEKAKPRPCCSVAESHPNLWDPMDCSMPGFPDLHYLPEFAQIHVHWVGDAIQPFHPLLLRFFCRRSFPASESSSVNQLLASGGQSIGASASSSVLPMNIQGWFHLGLSALIWLPCWEIYIRHCS